MNELQIFKNEQFGDIRVIEKDGEPWFVSKDICNSLDISKHRDAISRLDTDERGSVEVDTLGGRQSLSAVNEYGLYNLVLSSRKPGAKEFKRWITHEVIPSIRRTGGYGTQYKIPQTYAEALQLAADKEKQLELQAPKVLFADSVAVSKTSILVGELAKLIRQNGVPMGGTRLFKWLRENGYLISRKGTDYNVPTQKSMEMGLFKVKETVISHSDGTTSISKTTKVTGKGQLYFINKFLGKHSA